MSWVLRAFQWPSVFAGIMYACNQQRNCQEMHQKYPTNLTFDQLSSPALWEGVGL